MLCTRIGQGFGVETLLMEPGEVVVLLGSSGFGSFGQPFSNGLSVAFPLCWGCIIEILRLSRLPQHSSGPTVKSDLSLLALNSRAVTGRVFLSVKYPSSTCHILTLLSQLQNFEGLLQVGGRLSGEAHKQCTKIRNTYSRELNKVVLQKKTASIRFPLLFCCLSRCF